MARKSPRPGRSPGSPDVVLLNRRRMWSRLSRSQSVSFIWTSAARMSPPSVGLVLQGTEAPMWDTFSSVLTHSSAHSGGPTHGVCVYARNARVSRRTRIHLDVRICILRYVAVSPTKVAAKNCRDSRIPSLQPRTRLRDKMWHVGMQIFLRLTTLSRAHNLYFNLYLLNDKVDSTFR